MKSSSERGESRPPKYCKSEFPFHVNGFDLIAAAPLIENCKALVAQGCCYLLEELLGFIPAAGQSQARTLGMPHLPQEGFRKVTGKSKGKKESKRSFPIKFQMKAMLKNSYRFFFRQDLWFSNNEQSIQLFAICELYLQKQNRPRTRIHSGNLIFGFK